MLFRYVALFALLLNVQQSQAQHDSLTCDKNSAHDNTIELVFIGEATWPTGYRYEGVEVGGLSGLDYDALNQRYFAISDDRGDLGPVRFYTLNISLEDGKLEEGDVNIQSMTNILDFHQQPFTPGTVDPESIRVDPFSGLLYWSSEGNAAKGIAPAVRLMTLTGQSLAEFTAPAKFHPSPTSGIRNNLAFESLSFSQSGYKLFTATENALLQDGPEAHLSGSSPARVLELCRITGRPQREYIYLVDPVAEPPVPSDAFSTNGLVELLSLTEDTMIAVERSFSVGAGNNIRLYLASTRGATDVSFLHSVKQADFVRPIKKQLLLDLKTLGITLDNIEGITFGPRLSTGERTLILVSDNNFNPNGQFTQFLAFKMITPR